jgi:hypothetical protein
VNVTFVPLQTVLPGFAEMDAVGVTFAVTVMVITLLVAVDGLVQPKLLVIKQRTVFPFTKAEVIYVSLFVPTFDPFTCH